MKLIPIRHVTAEEMKAIIAEKRAFKQVARQLVHQALVHLN